MPAQQEIEPLDPESEHGREIAAKMSRLLTEFEYAVARRKAAAAVNVVTVETERAA